MCESSQDCHPGYRCASSSRIFTGAVCVSCLTESSTLEFVDDGKAFCDDDVTPSTGETPQPEETSETLMPSPADERPPCIAVDALRQFESEDLVFAEHVRATVMCDVHGNCATPGHIVVHKGRGMMMKSYCGLEEVECRYRVKYVNSPRMKMGMRIPSMSDDFVYTAFAARHESVVEEYVLSAIIRANF